MNLKTPDFLLHQDEGPNDRMIGKLCEYASKNPMRIPKVFFYQMTFYFITKTWTYLVLRGGSHIIRNTIVLQDRRTYIHYLPVLCS